MLKLLTPHLQLDSVLAIDGELLRALGVEGLLLDFDGTLKDYYGEECRPEILEWIRRMTDEQIRLCILSNGRACRIDPHALRLGVRCVAMARKPLVRGLRAGMGLLELDHTRVAIVGDQVFADVLAGRLAGIFTILVRPSGEREPWITYVKRPLERWVLRRVGQDTNREVRPRLIQDGTEPEQG